MAETTQDPSAVKTYLDDWTDDLDKAAKVLGLPSLTITAATVTADGGATVPSKTVINTGVIFKLEASGVASPGNITTTTSVTLSNGDTDVRRHLIEIRPT